MVGQTDGRTLYRFIDPATHTMRAVPINKDHNSKVTINDSFNSEQTKEAQNVFHSIPDDGS